MDTVILFIQDTLPILLVIAGMMIGVKLFLVFTRKGISAEAFLYSFFRLYDINERRLNRVKEFNVYMKWNNYINIYLYSTALVFGYMLVLFGHNAMK
ncbi:MAG: hypothetical protein LBE82_06865 [Chitinophagaceae bacterium]|jgi:hypothetical protein|nr:hypothetical protein [Chitinophagaceae bacterium]